MMERANDKYFSGWVLVFDQKEALQNQLDSNENFISLSNDEYYAFEELVLQQAFSDHVNEMKNKGEDARSFEDFVELFRMHSYYKLTERFNELSIEEVFTLIRENSFWWYPHSYYHNGIEVKVENMGVVTH
jgi:hypothetical protein